jgi:hypothetical protein
MGEAVVAIPRDPPDSGAPSDAYQSFATDVSVKVTDLVSYFWEMQSLQGQVRLNSMQALAPMQEMIAQGLSTPMDNNILPEAVYAAQMLTDRLSDFENFFNDVGNGIRDMGSAAAVIGEMYQNADSDSAATIDAVDFAFADPTASAPPRFRKVTTWSEADMAAMRASGGMAMASTDAYDNMAKVESTGDEWLRLGYPDGSSKEIVSYVQTPTAPGQSTAFVTTTTVYGSDGNLLSATTTSQYTTDNGAGQVRSQTVTEGDSRNGQSSTTTTSTAADGTVTVSGSITTTIDGKATTHARDPVVITTESHLPSPSDAGPVETLEHDWNTHGGPSTIQQYGPGY